MIIEFASEVSNLAWRVSQSQNGGAIFARTKWSPMFGSVVFDYQWCILIVMSVKSSFYNEYDIKNNEKPVFWAQRSFQNHHQTFHDRCPEKIGPLPKKSDHWSTRTCPENIRPAPTCLPVSVLSVHAAVKIILDLSVVPIHLKHVIHPFYQLLSPEFLGYQSELFHRQTLAKTCLKTEYFSQDDHRYCPHRTISYFVYFVSSVCEKPLRDSFCRFWMRPTWVFGGKCAKWYIVFNYIISASNISVWSLIEIKTKWVEHF